jgi:hypothetical protein
MDGCKRPLCPAGRVLPRWRPGLPLHCTSRTSGPSPSRVTEIALTALPRAADPLAGGACEGEAAQHLAHDPVCDESCLVVDAGGGDLDDVHAHELER